MSSFPTPQPGLIINYAYLWRNEAVQGQEEGRKNRPCMISHVLEDNGAKRVLVVPITHTPPSPKSHAVEMPLPTKQRLGLDEKRSWIVTDEVNYFEWPGYDLWPISSNKPARYVYGFAPRKLIDLVRNNVRQHATKRMVKRD